MLKGNPRKPTFHKLQLAFKKQIQIKDNFSKSSAKLGKLWIPSLNKLQKAEESKAKPLTAKEKRSKAKGKLRKHCNGIGTQRRRLFFLTRVL